MGSILINMPCGNQSFSRGYILGFSLLPGTFNTHLAGQVLRFDTGPGNEWYFPVTDEFFAPSTNSYTVDRIFDVANCFLYVGGNPTFAFVNVGIVVSPGETGFRVSMNCVGPQDPNQRADLAQPPYKWRPQ